jgi:hypothetical protein
VSKLRNRTTRQQEAALSALMAFRRPTRDRLVSLFREATESLAAGQSDLVILGARRATTFYHVLRLAGVVPTPQQTPHRQVLSDRFMALEEADKWSGGRNVFLVDDTKVTGQSEKTLLRLAKNMKFDVTPDHDGKQGVRVALDYSDPNGYPKYGDGSPTWLGKGDPHLHDEYTRAFARALTPLFADAPISEEASVSVETMNRAVKTLIKGSEGSQGSWEVANVTNAAIATDGGRNYTLFPRDDFLRELVDRFGPAANLVSVVKLRLFTMSDGLNRVRFRLVPLVLMENLSVEAVAEWLLRVKLINNDQLKILVGSATKDSFDKIEKGLRRKLGPALALMSYLLGRIFLQLFNERTALELFGQALIEDSQFTSVAMSERLESIIIPDNLRFLFNLPGCREKSPSDLVELLNPSFIFPEGEEWLAGEDIFGVGDDLCYPVFSQNWLPKRETTNGDEGKPKFLTLDELVEQLKVSGDFAATNQVTNSTWRNTVSLMLDVLNDLGHAVPVLRLRADSSTGQLLSVRGYRCGENAQPIIAGLEGNFSAFGKTRMAVRVGSG